MGAWEGRKEAYACFGHIGALLTVYAPQPLPAAVNLGGGWVPGIAGIKETLVCFGCTVRVVTAHASEPSPAPLMRHVHGNLRGRWVGRERQNECSCSPRMCGTGFN